MRNFYLKFLNFLNATPRELGWMHYRSLLKVKFDTVREFYETKLVGGT